MTSLPIGYWVIAIAVVVFIIGMFVVVFWPGGGHKKDEREALYRLWKKAQRKKGH